MVGQVQTRYDLTVEKARHTAGGQSWLNSVMVVDEEHLQIVDVIWLPVAYENVFAGNTIPGFTPAYCVRNSIQKHDCFCSFHHTTE